jgi:hypothetical protein
MATLLLIDLGVANELGAKYGKKSWLDEARAQIEPNVCVTASAAPRDGRGRDESGLRLKSAVLGILN